MYEEGAIVTAYYVDNVPKPWTMTHSHESLVTFSLNCLKTQNLTGTIVSKYRYITNQTFYWIKLNTPPYNTLYVPEQSLQPKRQLNVKTI